jgi:hypothetical protein
MRLRNTNNNCLTLGVSVGIVLRSSGMLWLILAEIKNSFIKYYAKVLCIKTL